MQLFPEPANATRRSRGAERTLLAGGGPQGLGASGRGRSNVSDSAVAEAGSPKQEDEHRKQEANSRDLFHGTDIHTFCLSVHKKAAEPRTNIRFCTLAGFFSPHFKCYATLLRKIYCIRTCVEASSEGELPSQESTPDLTRVWPEPNLAILWLQSHSHYRQLLDSLSTGRTDKERTGTMACPPGRERLSHLRIAHYGPYLGAC